MLTEKNTNRLIIIIFSLFVLSSCETFDEPLNVEDIDGNMYEIVKIGDQIWMAENLKVTHYRNGDPILYISDSADWSNTKIGAYCFYDNLEANKDLYGCLYNWYSATDDRNIAPKGWHVATNKDWDILDEYLYTNGFGFKDSTGFTNGPAKSIASKTGWKYYETEGTIGNNPQNNNSTGFNGLPGGFRYEDGHFDFIGEIIIWHTTDRESETWLCSAVIFWNDWVIDGLSIKEELGGYIRLVKD